MDAQLKEYTEDDHEAYLNELEPVDVLGCPYDVGTLLKEVDPIRFSCSYSDYESENQIWTCSVCDEEYDNEEDAEDCCKE